MTEEMMEKKEFAFCDQMVAAFEEVVRNPVKSPSGTYYTGVDLGTACVVLCVLDENRQPAAGAYRYADVVRDGMVVDYIGAIRIVREMKEELEAALGTELVYAAAALPPETESLDGGAVKNIVQAAGFELTCLLDEPTAANNLLQITDGAIADIGGGTTGISILKDGKVIRVADEPTGGTHFSLVLAGALRQSFEDAEIYKRDVSHHREIYPILKPVVEKIAILINQMTEGYEVKDLVLVGGSSCLTGIEEDIEAYTGIPTHKPANPMFVTPLGIAMSCTDQIRY